MESQITDQKIQAIADKIAKVYQPEKIILFGSWAWGKPHKDSDVDLFIVKDTDDIRKTAQEIDKHFFPRFFAMDIGVYTPSQLEKELKLEEPFVSKIAKKGRTLFENQ
jgi:uncharacterized protein